MSEPVFFPKGQPLPLRDIAEIAGAALPAGVDPDSIISGVAPLDSAGERDLAYMDNPKYAGALATTAAKACLVSRRFAAKVPAATIALVTEQPYRAYAEVLARLYPVAARPASAFGASGVSPGSFVHPTARLEHGVIVDPGAVIGPGAEVGSGTVIAAGAVIGPQVRIGRDCSISSAVSILHALIGNWVIIHPGVRIGQDGFGYAMGATGHRKVPQVGRVIIQDHVEIGANTTIDRGASRDTVIGEGTKIDNQVQVGHNVVIGRHCILVAQTGLSGSTTLGDHVILGARVGTNNHVTIGEGAQIAAISIVNDDVPPGARWGGTPAKPVKLWFREMKMLEQMAKGRRNANRAEQRDAAGEE